MKRHTDEFKINGWLWLFEIISDQSEIKKMDGSLDEHLQITFLASVEDCPHILFVRTHWVLLENSLFFSFFFFSASTRSTRAEDGPSNHQVIIIFSMRSSRHVRKNLRLSPISLSMGGILELLPSSSLIVSIYSTPSPEKLPYLRGWSFAKYFENFWNQ